jgi:hypothetical protein
MNNIFWQIHSAGLINQVMSVEIGCGIAYLEKKPISFFNFSNKSYGSIFLQPIVTMKLREITVAPKPNVFQLIDIPSDIEYRLINEVPNEPYCTHSDIITHYYKCGEGQNEGLFSEGRGKLSLNIHMHNFFHINCFAFYSRFFFSRPRGLDILLSKIRFKDEYVSLAKKIASQLKNFSSIHFRLTDHSKNYHATSENRMKHINRAKEVGYKIIYCTDDVNLIRSEMQADCLFVDEIILNHFRTEFLQLEFHDDVVLGLISMLVVSDSEFFIGTPGSTYSSYIHRLRYLNGKKDCFLFMDSNHNENFVQNGPYSWNGYNCHVAAKNWWREWPECRLNI